MSESTEPIEPTPEDFDAVKDIFTDATTDAEKYRLAQASALIRRYRETGHFPDEGPR